MEATVHVGSCNILHAGNAKESTMIAAKINGFNEVKRSSSSMCNIDVIIDEMAAHHNYWQWNFCSSFLTLAVTNS